MTTVQEEKIARRKLSLLQLAQELGNVSRACKIVGYSRQQFYEVRRNFQLYGAEGLIDQIPGPRGPHPNRVGEEVEAAILEHSLACPTQGARVRGFISVPTIGSVLSRSAFHEKGSYLPRGGLRKLE